MLAEKPKIAGRGVITAVEGTTIASEETTRVVQIF